MATPDDKRLLAAIHLLRKDVTRKEKKAYDLEVKTAFDDILVSSRHHGLSPEHIKELVSVMCQQKFSETANIMKIGPCLLPNSVVPSDAILRCISWICTQKPTDKFRIFSLGWILAVFDYIDNLRHLHCVYEIILQFIQHDGMRRYACMLLIRLTRKKDVLPYRVQRLLRLKSIVGSEPHLNSLLAIYKFYCPHLVNVKVPFNSAMSLPQNLRTAWTDRIVALQERAGIAAQKEVQAFRTSQIYWSEQDNMRGLLISPSAASVIENSGYWKRICYNFTILILMKKRKNPSLNATIPSVEDNIGPIVPFKETSLENRLVSLQEISSFEEILQNLQRLELPQQSLTILRYSDLQHVVSCLKDQEYLARFNFNLDAALANGYFYSGKSADALLERALYFADYLQEGVPILKTFLAAYLNYFWDGTEISNYIFKMIERLRLCSVEDLRFILLPIQKRYVLSDVNFKVKALCSLTRLLRNFTRVEWKRFWRMKNMDDQQSSQFIYLFDDETEDILPVDTIRFLIKFVDRLCNIGLMLENGNIVLLHISLSFYDAVTAVTLVDGLNFECVPSDAVIYFSFFSFDTAAFSRMSSLLVRCHEVLDVIKRSRNNVKIKSHNPIKFLNRYILDWSNCVWQRQPFAKHPGHLPSVFDFQDVGENVKSIIAHVRLSDDAFSLSQHPALANMAHEFAKNVDPERRSMYNRATANQFISFLAEKGFPGIRDFVHTFIRRRESNTSKITETSATASFQ